jgi:hypothetical protein
MKGKKGRMKNSKCKTKKSKLKWRSVLKKNKGDTGTGNGNLETKGY